MRRDAVVFAISGTFFGLIVGWILGSQAGRPAPGAVPQAATAAQAAGAQALPPLDARRVADLEQQANARPTDAQVRIELGNVYYDAERYDAAIPWYLQALALDPTAINASTDLAVSYYYTNQVDQALAQLERSLAIDPRHVKTLLNQGIIRAFGREDLDGATASWQMVVDIAPESEEGRQAKKFLDGLQGHPAGAPGAAGSGS
jgi:tetratricopeptide (TPR) repeat protein